MGSRSTQPQNTGKDRLRRGHEAQGRGSPTETLISLERTTQLDPTNSTAWFNLGQLYYSLQRYGAAITAFEHVIPLNPTNMAARNYLARSQWRAGHSKKGLETARQLTRVFPTYASGWMTLGMILNARKRHREALTAFDQALALDPGEVSTLNWRANTLRRLKRSDELLVTAEQVVTLDPENAQAWNDKGQGLHGLKRYSEALAAYEQAITLDPTKLWPGRNTTAVLYELKRYEDALSTLDCALAVAPNNLELWRAKGTMLLSLRRWRQLWGVIRHVEAVHEAMLYPAAKEEADTREESTDLS